MRTLRYSLAALAALSLLSGPASAGSSAAFPFKGSDGATYTGQTLPTDSAIGAVPMTSTAGVGGFTAMVSPSANGTAITCPSTARGVRFYFPPGTGLSFTIAPVQPTSAPLVMPLSQSTTGPNWDENLYGQTPYVTAVTGAPLSRCY